MKKYVLLLVFLGMFFACSSTILPYIIGVGEVNINEDNKYILHIDENNFVVNSVLLNNTTSKSYISPQKGQIVTCFCIGNYIGFIEGTPSSEEIKKVYLLDNTENNKVLPGLIPLVLLSLYAVASYFYYRKK